MDVFVFVLAIIFITTIGGLAREYMKNKTKQARSVPTEDNARRFTQLEERVQTLERIVTDQKSQLSEKINSL